MYDEEIRLLRQLVAAYDEWPHNVECVKVADTLRSTINALQRLADIEVKALIESASVQTHQG